MFFDLSGQKAFAVGLIAVAIASSIAVSMTLNGLWSLAPRAASTTAREESDFMYWLLYKLPEGSAYGAAPAAREGSARSIPVLLYHGESGGGDMNFPTFLDQMRTLKAAGWQTITMAQFDAYMREGASLPDKSFLLTFDDGRKDSFYPVDPALRDLGFHAVMFVITGFSLPDSGKESNFYLDKTELEYMQQSGRWDLESHGKEDHAWYAVQSTTDLARAASTTPGHFLSNKFWSQRDGTFETGAEFAARIRDDLALSKQTLENDFGIPVLGYAYPFNDFGQDTVNFPGAAAIVDRIVPSLYRYAFYQTWPENGDTFDYPGINNGPGTSAYMIKRIEPGNDWSGRELLAALDAGSAKALPYRQNSSGKEWVGTWGGAAASSAGVSFFAKPATSGASAFLNGSGWWTNYLFDATIEWQAGRSVSLIARNENDSDYLACAYSPGSVSIEEHAGPTQIVLARAPRPQTGAGSAIEAGIGVAGQQVVCFEDGSPLVGASFSGLSQGGIGVEIWDKTLGEARGALASVSARSIGALPAAPR